MDKYWDDSLYSYDFESKQYYQDAKDMLKNYSLYLKNNKPSPILFEYFFTIHMRNCILSGVMDRLDIDADGKIKIYDYKTSKTQKTESKIKNSFQLPIYALAVYLKGEEFHPKLKNDANQVSVSELSLRFDDIEKSIELSKENLEEVKAEINEVAKQISSKVFKANPNMMNCAYCDYKKFVCSYYK